MSRPRIVPVPPGLPDKQCGKCKQIRPPTDFYYRRERKSLSSKCRLCFNAYSQKWRENNHERYRIRNRQWRVGKEEYFRNIWLKSEYGISAEHYDNMLEQQGDVCAICKQPETTYDARVGVKRLAVDHCHTTGQVRGLLCAKCNRGLGHFNHCADGLQKAIEYLRKAEERTTIAEQLSTSERTSTQPRPD